MPDTATNQDFRPLTRLSFLYWTPEIGLDTKIAKTALEIYPEALIFYQKSLKISQIFSKNLQTDISAHPTNCNDGHTSKWKHLALQGWIAVTKK